MAQISNNNLTQLNYNIRRSKVIDNPETFIFVVIQLQRYLLDPDYKIHSGLDATIESELYDVTLSDEVNKTKCLLNPTLNHLAQHNKLRAGSLVRFRGTDCHIHCNDTSLDADPFIILDHLAILDDYTERLPDLEYCSFCGSREKGNIPLVTGRGTYLPLWNIEDLHGLPWEQMVPVSDNLPDNSGMTIEELATSWKHIRPPYGHLIVRVVNKSRIRMYGKVEKRDRWPYQLYFEIADSTGVCSAIAWTSLCADLLHSIHEGSVLIISSYKVRERFSLMSKPTCRINVNQFNIEISLDKRNPQSDIRVVAPDAVSDNWAVPVLRGEFFSRKQISSLPDKCIIDIVGVVLHVGRYHRLHKDHQHYCYRWLHLADPSSTQPLIVELFSTSQPEIQRRLLPGCVMILTQMRVVHNLQEVTRSRQRRTIYVTTTNESQVTVHLDEADNIWSTNETVLSTILWRKSSSCQNLLLQKACIGGYEDYRTLPTEIDTFIKMQQEGTIELTSAAALPDKMTSMCYRDTKRLYVQCKLLYLQYHSSRTHNHKQDVSQGNSHHSCPEADISSPLRSSEITQQSNKSPTPSTSKRTHSPDEISHKLPKTQPSVIPMEIPIGNSTVIVDDLYDNIMQSVPVCGGYNIDLTAKSRAWSFYNGSNVYNTCYGMPSEVYNKVVPVNLAGVPLRPLRDHLTLVLSGLNNEVAIIVHFLLPLFLPPESSTLIQILSNQSQSSNLPPQSTEDRDNIVQRILTSAPDLSNRRLLCVMDAYSHGSSVELMLNRACPLTR